ncbi:MAG: type II toxin-antitoxin system prevent-host-death family antitoxin [Azonexus sp.]|jgi:prevent-host-death family protein|nr:type II toxin-antitoxin system prevent-host-death family antitoxin [Azonexus sp.]
MMKIEVGAYEAKTKLPELLRGVQMGKQYTITNRGVAIADLVPTEGAKRHQAAAVEQMKAFMARNPVKGVDIKALIEEGRA